jgi:hypothetical protein
MPLFLIFIGIILVYTEINGTADQLFSLIYNDFTGENSFEKYLLGLIVIGAVGYVPKLKPISDGFLILTIVVLLLHNESFFTNLNESLSG